ncbi:TlpA family protein disulfide reductase [Marinigracilibium pacificum]|nr:TlpA disulfide reductase family protein [Marinigracilibium pacificum]
MLKIPFFEASVNENDTNKSIKSSISVLDEANKKITHDFEDYDFTFINFWASWCPPCIAEMPSIQKLYNQTKENKNIKFLMISSDSDFSKAKNLKIKKEFTFPIYSLAFGLPEQLNHSSIPYTVIIDKSGTIIYEKEGMANYNSDKIIELLR